MTVKDMGENWIAVVLASSVVAAIVSSIVAVLTSERRLASENVIQERTKWREHVRNLAKEVNDAISTSDSNKLRELGARIALRLNPHDAEDQEILTLIASSDATRADEFNQRVMLLLKHDWERAKRDGSLWRLVFKTEPTRCDFGTSGRANSTPIRVGVGSCQVPEAALK
jgi:DNA-binding PucR family transcriptional regulator